MPDNQNSSDLAQRAYEAWRDTSPDGDSQWPKWKAVAAALTAPAMLNGVEGLESKLRSLYERIRPSVEVAPWVHDEIKAMLAADNRDAAGVAVRERDCTQEAADKFYQDGWNACLAANTPTAAPAGEAVAPWGFLVDGVPFRGTKSCDKTSIPLYTHPPAAEVREVDEAMVRRAVLAIEYEGADDICSDQMIDRMARAALTAALSPPGRAEGDSDE